MPKELEDIVVSVDIFMTKPVSIFEDKMHYFGQEESAQRKFKTQSKIEEELAESLGNFYMIHSIPFDDIVKAEVNKVYAPYIERGRISQIEQQPTLQSYSQHIDRYKVSYMYNNSLHVAGLTTEFFKGYDRSIVPICSPSRDEGTSAEAKIRSLVGVKDLIDDVRLNASVTINDNGNKYTVSTPIHIPDLANEYAFRWFVYPDEKAEFMEVNGLTIVSHSLTKRNVMTIPIKKEIIYKLSAKNGFAYKESMKDVKMLDSELSLFDVAGATKTEESLKFRANKSDDKFSAQLSDNETNLYERTKNLMKVSAVGDIEEFPYAKTYLVGSGEIIGLSTATTALSQGQFGQFPLYVFCTDGIYVMEQGSGGAYVNTKPLSREVCNNANSITQIDGAVVFSTAKGLMVISGGKVEPFAHHLIGRIYYRPTDEFAQGWYKRAISHEQLVELYDAVSSVDFLKYLSDKATRISYIYDKGKLMVYNPTFVYCYFIDIQSGRASKLNRQVLFTNNDYPSEQYALLTEEAGIVYTVMPYRYEGEHVETMLQTQPIRIDPNNFTRNTRVVLRGYFNSPEHVGIYVYGSNDSHAWAYIGGTEKKGEVYDLGTTIERMTVKYLMVVFVGRLHDDSYINELEIMGDTKYNYKLR